MAKIERVRNAKRNIISGVILKGTQVIAPFIMRTVIIYIMGIQYLGLSSLFASVLSVLNLAELGVGSAMVYSMYEPIATDDYDKICALLKLYRFYYRIIGIIIAVCGIVSMPFLPYLIKGDIPQDINLYILYFINLIITVISYWMFAYKASVLQAYQRTDVISNACLFTSFIQYGLQIFVLWRYHNYYYFMIVVIFTTIITNFITAYFSKKLFPRIIPYGELAEDTVRQIKQRIRDLFTTKVATVIMLAADNIVISAFLGLTVLAIYQNYFCIINVICGFNTVIFNSIKSGIGNSLVTDSKEKIYNDFKVFTFIICFILCVSCSCFAGLFQPFMKLWVGENLMLKNEYVVLLCILFYCLELARIWATIKDAAGLWHYDKYRTLIGSMANLVMNIILVNIIGLPGVIVSTVFSYVFISMPWLVYNLFRFVYFESKFLYLKDVVEYILVTIMTTTVVSVIVNKVVMDGLMGLIAKGLLCLSIPVMLQFIVYRKKREFIESIVLIKRMLSGDL